MSFNDLLQHTSLYLITRPRPSTWAPERTAFQLKLPSAPGPGVYGSTHRGRLHGCQDCLRNSVLGTQSQAFPRDLDTALGEGSSGSAPNSAARQESREGCSADPCPGSASASEVHVPLTVAPPLPQAHGPHLCLLIHVSRKNIQTDCGNKGHGQGQGSAMSSCGLALSLHLFRWRGIMGQC